MPRTYSSIDKIRAELAWVTETQILTNAAVATFDAVKKPATIQVHVPALSLRSSGRFVRNTTVRLAVNMNGATVGIVLSYRATRKR